MNATQEIEYKALNILKTGYMPQDNKNLITWSFVTSLFIITAAASFQIGYKQAIMTNKSSLFAVQEYGNLEAKIIKSYEERSGITSTINKDNHKPLYKYYAKDGTIWPMYTTPPRDDWVFSLN